MFKDYKVSKFDKGKVNTANSQVDDNGEGRKRRAKRGDLEEGVVGRRRS